MDDCIFCSIIKNEIKSEVLYEDKTLVVLTDVNPQAPVHLLIIPRKHIRSINNLLIEDKVMVSHMIMIGKEMAKQKKINESGYKMFFNVEKGGGQIVFHIHLHLVGGW